jgi:methyl-accepting chemotaxis protein
MKGFVIFESFKAYSFSEDDIDRFCSIVPFISRIINTFINIQELIEFSKEIDKSSIKFRDFGFDTRNISDKIKLSVNDVYTGFSKIREKLHKEFETLENIGKMIEDTIGEISGIKDDIKNLKSSVKELLKPVDRMRVALEDFEKRIRFLEEKIEENVSLIERIQGFTDFMRDYASKTRLLSLNAAIEATRLGEKARGFSIIAEEIGDLSQSVEDVVKKITSEFESVYEFFQDIRNKMSEYNTLINEKKKDIEPFIEKERVILDKILEIMPYFENIPEKLGKSLREFSEVVVKLGENIEETEKGTKRIEEIVKNVEKMEKNVKNFLDSLKILEEYKNKVIEVERMLRKYEG